MKTETEFLGLIVGKSGIKIGDDRKKLVRDWPTPSNITEFRSFLGLVQFFRRFIKDFSRIAIPLTNLTRKNANIGNWNNDCDTAFAALKEHLISAPIMRAPDWSRAFRCHTDASQLAVGGTLTQRDDAGSEYVISFFSKRLSPAEENYSANDRELLGLVYFLQRFRCYLEGTEFEVLTDNQVLKHFFSKTQLSRREARWVEFLGHFGISQLTLVKGKIHVLGDAPSRAPHAEASPAGINMLHSVVPTLELPNDFKSNYESDITFGEIYRYLKGNKPENAISLARLSRLSKHFRLLDDVLYYDGLICVPKANVKDILFLAHDNKTSGHFGYTKTLSRLKLYHWRNKSSDVHDYCAGCTICQENKDGRTKPLRESQPLELPTRRWGSISMDFVSHLPKTDNGYDSITTFVDRFSKRIRLIPSKGTDSATDVAECFFQHIFRLHGLPDSIVSDRDPKFTSKFWSHLMDCCGIKLKMSTSRHPQTDGATEIMNRMIGNYLRCYCAFNQKNWDKLLVSAEFAYNARIDSMRMSPFEADLGWQPRSPLELLANHNEDKIQTVTEFRAALRESFKSATFAQHLAQSRQAAYNNQRYRPPSYKVGDEVYLSRKLFTDSSSSARPCPKLSVRRVGPFRIVGIIGKTAVRLDLSHNIKIHPVVHVEHTARAFKQPKEISQPRLERGRPFINDIGERVIKVSKILAHRKR